MNKLTKALTGVLFGSIALCSVVAFAACDNGNEHVHDWSTDYTVDLEPTCTEAGSKSKHCTVDGCEEKNDVTVIPAAHKWATEYTVDVEPGCTTFGSKSIHCTVDGCNGKKDSVAVPENGHSWATIYTVDEDPTCTVAGSKSYHCTVDGCDGKTGVTEVPASGHDWADDYAVDKEPTCTEAGIQSVHCKVDGCNGTKDELPLDALGHLTEAFPATSSTCSVKGHEAYWYCDDCKSYFEDEECTVKIDGPVEHGLLPHNYDMVQSMKYQVNATCTKDGYKTYYLCNDCGGKFTNSAMNVPITDEMWENEYVIKMHPNAKLMSVKDPTCTAKGYSQECYYCSSCKKYSVDRDFTQLLDAADVEIAALGHLPEEGWTTDKPATCSTVGKESHHCTRSGCTGKLNTRDIDKLPHTWKTEYTVDEQPTCATAGSKSYHCKDCDAINEDSVTAVPISADSHDWSIRSFIKTPATCVAEGTQAKRCLLCDAVQPDEVIPVNPTLHNYSKQWTVDVEPTCVSAGSQSHHCVDCDEKSDVTELPALGHYYNWQFDGLNGTATCTNGCNDTKTATLHEAAEGKTINNVVEANASGVRLKVYSGTNYVVLTQNSHFLEFTATTSGKYLFSFEHLVTEAQLFLTTVYKGDTNVTTSQAKIVRAGSSSRTNVISVEIDVMEGETVALTLNGNSAKTPGYLVTASLKEEIVNKTLVYGNNKVKVTVSGDLSGVDSYTFTPTETKKYSITVPDNLAVTMNGNDLISAGNTADFSATNGKAITFAFIHTTTGDYEVVIGEENPATLELGKTVAVNLTGKTLTALTVGKDLAPGKYKLTFTGSFLKLRMTGYGKMWLQVNGNNDFNGLSTDSALYLETNAKTDLPGYSISTGAEWVVTLELAAGDVVYLAPDKYFTGNINGVLDVTLTKA